MKIEELKTQDIIPYVNNARTHSDEQILQIAASIREFGFRTPLLIDAENTLIAGHGRLLAAKKLGLEQVPCIRHSDLTDAQRKAYIIADNKLALNSGWDEELLKIELEDLKGLDFDIDILGFDPSEISFKEIDYSILDDHDEINERIDDMALGVRKAIQIEFEPHDYAEAQELVKWWRDAGAYVGEMIMIHLRTEKDKAME